MECVRGINIPAIIFLCGNVITESEENKTVYYGVCERH